MKWLILPLLCFYTLSSIGQEIKLKNPSFEGFPYIGTLSGPRAPVGWMNCGQKGETPPDLHGYNGKGELSSWYKVNQKPSDGKTYLGLVVRDNNTWEGVSTRIPKEDLESNKEYELSISLARSDSYYSFSRNSREEIPFSTPVILQMWGAKDYCGQAELLVQSPAIKNTDWERYSFTFTPSDDYAYLLIEAYFGDHPITAFNGNLLLDNLKIHQIRGKE